MLYGILQARMFPEKKCFRGMDIRSGENAEVRIFRGKENEPGKTEISSHL